MWYARWYGMRDTLIVAVSGSIPKNTRQARPRSSLSRPGPSCTALRSEAAMVGATSTSFPGERRSNCATGRGKRGVSCDALKPGAHVNCGRERVRCRAVLASECVCWTFVELALTKHSLPLLAEEGDNQPFCRMQLLHNFNGVHGSFRTVGSRRYRQRLDAPRATRKKRSERKPPKNQDGPAGAKETGVVVDVRPLLPREMTSSPRGRPGSQFVSPNENRKFY